MLNINIWDIVWTIVNLLLFFVLLRIFLFKPVLKVMNEREKKINDDLESAQADREESEELKAQYEAQLADVHEESDKIRKAAKNSAEMEKAQIIANAHAEANRLIADAQKTIERDKQEAIESAHNEIAGLAVLTAARIVSKNIDQDTDRAYAEQLLAEVGAEKNE